jgi:hypothetical protein
MVQIHQIQTVQSNDIVLFYVFYTKDEAKFFDLLTLEELEELEAGPKPAETIPPEETTTTE